MFDETLLSAHIDGELDGEVRQSVEAALSADPALAQRFRDLDKSRSAVASLSRPIMNTSLAGAVVCRIEHERGVLRRQVPLWLSLPEFRSLVVGFEEAHVGHGGEGALYVRIRRARG